ncbi:MAG: hypothetical protein HY390_07915 [Deltaproteobacteria bacterium]|nr:hypothetical protein [Deltaproteobacteria bacterium]
MQRNLLKAVINKIIIHKNQVEAFYIASKEIIEKNWKIVEKRESSQASLPQNDNPRSLGLRPRDDIANTF